jgi:hypothetical protein
VEPNELHRHHAGHDAKSKGWRVDAGGLSWRPDGKASTELKRATALRLAVCWNICEGIPTDALLAGVVRDQVFAARDVCAAVEREPGLFSAEVRALAERFRAADGVLSSKYEEPLCDCGLTEAA